MDSENNPTIVLITLDRNAGCAILTRSDGKEARLPLTPSPFEETSVLARIDFTPSYRTLLATTLSGDQVLFEMPLEKAGNQLLGRLIVYLDQNQWSAISNALYDEERGTEKNRTAAQQLKRWVEQGKIILPASAAHYYETSKRFNKEKRYYLGLTILQYSRGWQMRDPLQVRRDELHNGFCRYTGRPSDVRTNPVFTLDPYTLYSTARHSTPIQKSIPTKTPLDFRIAALTEAVSSIDVMLDSERVESGLETGWTPLNQKFSDWLDSENRDSQQKRKTIDAFLLSDLQKEIAEEAWASGATIPQLKSWALKHAANEIAQLPATGLFREMLHSRHLNKGTKWSPNDLTDMVYLSCAAGYADFVACERHMRDPLKHGLKRTKKKTQVYRDLTDAVAAIKEALETAQTPKASISSNNAKKL
ncbi:hypothetical protein J0910_03600 [Nocardiopsis sp. CNT-189]|uniref:hypothetical protein n=1 Tax=Nocardiopsis oceanisediminis TaxID=2816862 RepID=UPI003B2E6B5C